LVSSSFDQTGAICAELSASDTFLLLDGVLWSA
jgi:hypothetical protein